MILLLHKMLSRRLFLSGLAGQKKPGLALLRSRRFSESNKCSAIGQAETMTAWESAKPFSEIPSPPKQMFFGHANLLSKNMKTIHKFHEELHRKYGNIVLLSVPGRNIVCIYDPEDARIVYGNDGRIPEMAGFEAFEFYR